ncbi:hypothetical protein [Nitrosomonas sp. Is37]|uniref:hypothetical protein n=1 Tax=Nitrosomonas sp. Is37 TaxID=3080535 RepID=UPI00294AA8EC|nr:hypothetical protein [Nitrosomonas sp. Is37]MDV6342979.1 hypothetical protein [Nitrosomonas sp. Is37]
MSQQSASELYKIATETTAKYIYFLLATSGAAIACSVQVAEMSKFSWPLTFLVLALLSWGLSFYAGCKSLQFDISVHNLSFDVQQHAETMRVVQEVLPEQEYSSLREDYEKYIQQVNQTLNMHDSKVSSYLGRQFRWFITGIVAFVVWRATEFIIKRLSENMHVWDQTLHFDNSVFSFTSVALLG